MAQEGRVELGSASYRAHQIGDELLLFATGVHPTRGFRVFFDDQDLRSDEPVFAFMQVRPTGMVPQVITPFQHHETFSVEHPVQRVIIIDADGRHTISAERFPLEAEVGAESMFATRAAQPCGDSVREIIAAWAGNSIFTDDQSLGEIYRRGNCNNGAIAALARALRDRFGAAPSMSCSTPVGRVVRQICG